MSCRCFAERFGADISKLIPCLQVVDADYSLLNYNISWIKKYRRARRFARELFIRLSTTYIAGVSTMYTGTPLKIVPNPSSFTVFKQNTDPFIVSATAMGSAFIVD